MTPPSSRWTLGRDYVVLVPRDADWALALWELTADGLHRASQHLPNPSGPARLVLRVYDSAVRAGRRGRSEPIAYPVDHWLGERMVLLGRPGSPHQAVIGLLDDEGTFVSICRSDILTLSEASPTPPPDSAA